MANSGVTPNVETKAGPRGAYFIGYCTVTQKYTFSGQCRLLAATVGEDLNFLFGTELRYLVNNIRPKKDLS